jgi:hypothetical protein
MGKDKCLKYGDLVLLHHNSKNTGQDHGAPTLVGIQGDRKEGYLGAMG